MGELRSLIPSHVNVITLTATATKATYDAICKRLSMVNPVLVGCPPHHSNIYYSVKSLPSMEQFCTELAESIKVSGLEYPKTVIFCRRYTDCSTLYCLLRQKLKEYFTFPPNYPDLHDFCLIDMYTSASTLEMKEKVLFSMCDPAGKLRVILATRAFGMGVDCHNIRHVIHWSPPSSLEEYAQQSG